MGRKVKVLNLQVNTYGNYLGIDKGCITLRDKEKKVQRFPLSEAEVGEIVLNCGNTVSVDALAMLALWGIDVVIATHNGRPIAMLKNLADDSHVKTRIAQYESLINGKGIDIAKQIIIAKLLSQNLILKKYGLRQHDLMRIKETINELETQDLGLLRKRLTNIEGRFSRNYFGQVFQLFPYGIRPDRRRGQFAYDGVNNLFNLAYEQLFWKCYRALSKAHLETHMGYVHIPLFGRPSLVCDFVELYRYLFDDYLIRYSKDLMGRDFVATAFSFKGKKGKRMFLSRKDIYGLLNGLYAHFRTPVMVPRMNKGNKQEIESLINEEAFQLAKYLREKFRFGHLGYPN